MDFVGELCGLFHAAMPTPSFVLFFAFLDLWPDLEPQMRFAACRVHALLCFVWSCPQPAICLFISYAVAAMKARHFPQEKLAQ